MSKRLLDRVVKRRAGRLAALQTRDASRSDHDDDRSVVRRSERRKTRAYNTRMQLAVMTDAALLASLHAVCREGHRITARLVAHLAEVEDRSLHLKAACSSMFDYCVRRLGMSEGAAHRRLTAARLVRRFPSLLDRLERGEVHLSGLALVAKHLMTEASFEELVSAIAGKGVREIEIIVARYAPVPDVPDRICRVGQGAQTSLGAEPSTPTGAATGMATAMPAVEGRSSRIAPLSEQRFKVQFTASSALREKLERARDRMRHANPSGDLAVVIERALDLLLEKQEKERLGKARRPRAGARSKAEGISRAVRREVFERDAERCTFHSEDGSRCPSRAFLELDHIDPRAKGGSNEAANLRVRCRAHNLLYAEEVFGRDYVARRVDLRRRKSQEDVAGRCRDDDVERASVNAARLELALRGLMNLGFGTAEARRAIGVVEGRDIGKDIPVADLLRGAIALLT